MAALRRVDQLVQVRLGTLEARGEREEGGEDERVGVVEQRRGPAQTPLARRVYRPIGGCALSVSNEELQERVERGPLSSEKEGREVDDSGEARRHADPPPFRKAPAADPQRRTAKPVSAKVDKCAACCAGTSTSSPLSSELSTRAARAQSPRQPSRASVLGTLLQAPSPPSSTLSTRCAPPPRATSPVIAFPGACRQA